MIYPNLRAEIARKGWTLQQLADAIQIKAETLKKKLQGYSDLKLSEARKIKEVLGVDIPLEILFEKEGEVA